MNRTLTIALALLVGCATIVAPNAQTVKLNTDPPGQTVMVDGQPHTTPAEVLLSTEGNHTVKWPDGTESVIKRTFQPWVIGNALFGLVGLVIGIPIDILSGASGKNLTPRKIDWRQGEGVLKPEPAASDE